MPHRIVSRFFRIGIALKGLDGIIEVLGGVLLLFAPISSLHGWATLATYHLAQDHHAFIAHAVANLDQHLTAGVALFAALYLLGHGLVKIALVTALWQRRYRVFPWAIGFLLTFIFYQSYRIGYDHSMGLAVLTALDAIITWLVYLEWRHHTATPMLDRELTPGLELAPRRLKQTGLFTVVCAALVVSGVAIAVSWPQATTYSDRTSVMPLKLEQSVADIHQAVADFKTKQTATHTELASPEYLDEELAHIDAAMAHRQYALAAKQITDLKASLAKWTEQLTGPTRVTPTPRPAETNGRFIPIVLYHYTPANFEEQLAHLDQAGYTTVDLDQVAAALAGTGSLPAKPVVITYDDGFSDQLHAFELLKKHHMKATFYIINGGPASRWCFGAGRRYNDPLQPPGGCGDNYMTWDQVRLLDRSGLITIAGHTLDHLNLASLPADQQRHQIADSKAGIEREIGHPIRHFAYPYGNYNATTIELVRQAGYVTAVTTIAGDYQTPSQPLLLRRIRDTLTLP